MTLYWKFVPTNYASNKKTNCLILVLEVTDEDVTYVVLGTSLKKLDIYMHSVLVTTKINELQISGLVPQEVSPLLEDYLTNASTVIRDYAIAFFKKNQQS